MPRNAKRQERRAQTAREMSPTNLDEAKSEADKSVGASREMQKEQRRKPGKSEKWINKKRPIKRAGPKSKREGGEGQKR